MNCNAQFSEISGERAFSLVEKLHFERVAGTPDEMRAARILADELQSFGLKGELEAVPIPVSDVSEVRLFSGSGTEYECAAYAMSGSTGPDGLTAPFFYAEDGDDISLSQVSGRIVLLNNRPTPELYKKLTAAGAAGFISVSGTPADDPERVKLAPCELRPGRHYPLEGGAVISGVVIRYPEALRLLQERPETVTIRLSQQQREAASHNLIADIPGAGGTAPDEWMIFCAHYDSVPYSTGAYDNAAGCAIIMELCRYFKAHPPLRPCRFIWFGAEERGLLGSQHYVKAHADFCKKAALVFNVDLAGQLIGSHHAVVTADEALCGVLRFLAGEAGRGIEVSSGVYSSDSSSFADHGVPAMSFYRGGYGAHSGYDALDLISAKSLQSSSEFASLIAARLANCRVLPFSREIPEEIRKKLDWYFNRA